MWIHFQRSSCSGIIIDLLHQQVLIYFSPQVFTLDFTIEHIVGFLCSFVFEVGKIQVFLTQKYVSIKHYLELLL